MAALWVVLSVAAAAAGGSVAAIAYAVLWPVGGLLLVRRHGAVDPPAIADGRAIAFAVTVGVALWLVVHAVPGRTAVDLSGLAFMLLFVIVVLPTVFFIPDLAHRLNTHSAPSGDHPQGTGARQRKARMLFAGVVTFGIAALAVIGLRVVFGSVGLPLYYLLAVWGVFCILVYRADAERFRADYEADRRAKLLTGLLVALGVFGFGVSLWFGTTIGTTVGATLLVVSGALGAAVFGGWVLYETIASTSHR